jgi:ribosomal-protein-alanine N-acetyltransferase
MAPESASLTLDTRLETSRLILRAPRAIDIAELRSVLRRNAEHLRPWSPSPPPGVNPVGLTELGRSIAKQRREWKAGIGYVFVAVLRRGSQPIIGRVALTSVARGPWQSAQIGYWVDAANGGRGLMSEGVEVALAFAFEQLALHRVQAAVMPQNHASRRILEKCGFREEGRAARYLQISGAWEDHLIYGLTEEEWRPSSIQVPSGELADNRESRDDGQLEVASGR